MLDFLKNNQRVRRFDLLSMERECKRSWSKELFDRFFEKFIIQAADYPAARYLVGTSLAPNVDPLTRASAASLVNPINYAITFYSGTNAMTGFQLPSNFSGAFAVIPTAASTGTTGGTYANDGTTASIPMGKAFTNVAQKVNIMVTDGNLVYPSYIA